jgi:uncharacterized protein (TIGR03435 family)
MRRASKLLCWLAAAASGLFGQSFEVVSVKPSGDGSTGSDIDSNNNIFKARNVTLQRLIAMANGVEDYRIEGPGWLGSERFDIDAKFPADAPRVGPKADAAFEAMMQNMLTDRFGLVVHSSQKTLAVYGLVVAKSGLKISEVKEGSSDSSSHNNQYSGTSITMSRFAQFLSRRADLPVVDMTGLKGFYTFALDWTPEPDAALAPGENPAWEALREVMEAKLGLRCENRKAPIGIVVVDHADKAPTAN